MKVADSESAPPGRYRKISTLGAGGMGVVYLAEDTRLQRRVAVKQLRSDAASSSANSRIRSEAQLLASLNHPNIVQLYDVFEQGGNLALVMEYIEGPTLKRWMQERNRGLVQKLELLVQVCRGLGAAHALGIIHRDLKPDNILIASDGTAKIADFGIAKSLCRSGDKLTREGHVAGSIGTMSPEQLQGNSPDPRSDLFSLGTLAYQLLCEHNPFGEGNSPFETAERIVRKAHPPATRFRPDLPKELCRLLDRLLEKNPQKRPVSAAAVASELNAVLLRLDSKGAEASNSRTGSTTSDTTTGHTATVIVENLYRRRNSGRRRRRIIAAVALLLAAAAGTLLLFSQQRAVKSQYIAVVAPVEVSRQDKDSYLLAQSALNAIRRGLTNRHGLYLVPYVESLKLRGQPTAIQARALNAQLLLQPHFTCNRGKCELILELIDVTKQLVKAQRKLSLTHESFIDSFEETLQQINFLLPEFPPREAEPRLNISEADYRRFLELDAHSTGIRTAKVTEDTLRGLEILQRRIPDYPPLYLLYSQLATDNRLINRNADAVRRLEVFLALAPGDIADSYEVLSAKLFLANLRYDWARSGELLTRIKPVIPDPANYYYLASVHHLLQDNYREALKAIDAAVALRPSTNHLMQKATVLSYAGDLPASIALLERVLDIDNDHFPAVSLLAANHLDMGNIGETIRLLDTASPEQLTEIDRFNLCTAYFLDKNFPRADRCFADFYADIPEDLEPLIYRAEIASELGEGERALVLARRVHDLARGQQGWENQLILAQAYALLHQPEQAVATLMQTRQQAPDDTYTNHAYAQVYITTDDMSSAEAHIRRALELGQSPVWYQTRRFQKVCHHPGFADLRAEYPALCHNRQVVDITQK